MEGKLVGRLVLWLVGGSDGSLGRLVGWIMDGWRVGE